MFIIDGHNLLYAIRKVEEDSEEVSDVELCRTVGEYFKQIGGTGEIIFDGTGPPEKTGFENIVGLEVSFAGLGTDTDTIIEGRISASSAPKGLTIVSTDRRLRKAAQVRKATSVKSEIFWAGLQKHMSRKRPPKEPVEKRQGVSESETKQWLEFFGLDQ
ncbi:MAG: NYN domain-containing protein [Planctomycetota bacterium]